jgi:predicted esterase
MNTWKSPVFLIHGDDDRNVRFSQTVDLAERLRKAKTESTSAESEEGRLLIKENTLPLDTYPT